MVKVYTSDAEQIDEVKKWGREYGVPVLIGVIIALLIGFGWRWWQHRQEQKLTHASMRYEQLLTEVVNGNTDAVEAQANRLEARYPHTPYAQLAALQLARQYVYQNNYNAAETQLRWVMKHGDTKAFQQVARLRIARLLLAQQQPQQALDLLEQINDKSYTAAVWEIRGDAYLALSKPAMARTAYENAVHAFPGLTVMQPLLQMKIDNLAGAAT